MPLELRSKKGSPAATTYVGARLLPEKCRVCTRSRKRPPGNTFLLFPGTDPRSVNEGHSGCQAYYTPDGTYKAAPGRSMRAPVELSQRGALRKDYAVFA